MAIPTGATTVRLKIAPQRGQMLALTEIMPPQAEFTTDGSSKMLDSGHAPDEDKDAIEQFEKQAIAMAEARRCPVHLQVLHNGRVVHPKSYGNADTREI
jgi:hypothetical protein